MFDYKKFKMCCLEYGETEAEVARKIGISRAAITGWKKGSQPSAANIKKLAKYFDASVAFFEKNEEIEEDENTGVLYLAVDEDEMNYDGILEELRSDPDLRMLLSASSKLNEEDKKYLISLAKRMNRE